MVNVCAVTRWCKRQYSVIHQNKRVVILIRTARLLGSGIVLVQLSHKNNQLAAPGPGSAQKMLWSDFRIAKPHRKLRVGWKLSNVGV